MTILSDFSQISNRLDDRGISIIGTVFTLIILGVLGAAMVSLVAMDQESRMRSINRENAFYAVQAGFEYALREINEGGYPIAVDKQIGDSTFTVVIDPSLRKITVVGSAGDVNRTHSITADNLAGDCDSINIGGVTVGGASNNELQNITVTKTCLNAITIDTMTFGWTPDLGEEVRRIRIDGVNVYDDPNGSSSDEIINILDKTIGGVSTINVVEFSSSIVGKNITMTLAYTDSSESSVIINIP